MEQLTKEYNQLNDQDTFQQTCTHCKGRGWLPPPNHYTPHSTSDRIPNLCYKCEGTGKPQPTPHYSKETPTPYQTTTTNMNTEYNQLNDTDTFGEITIPSNTGTHWKLHHNITQIHTPTDHQDHTITMVTWTIHTTIGCHHQILHPYHLTDIQLNQLGTDVHKLINTQKHQLEKDTPEQLDTTLDEYDLTCNLYRQLTDIIHTQHTNK